MVPNTTNFIWWDHGRPIPSWVRGRYNDGPDNILDISSSGCYRISPYRVDKGKIMSNIINWLFSFFGSLQLIP